jgi:hypothetical protein
MNCDALPSQKQDCLAVPIYRRRSHYPRAPWWNRIVFIRSTENRSGSTRWFCHSFIADGAVDVWSATTSRFPLIGLAVRGA